MCDVKNGEEQWEVPVLLLEVSEKDRTHQLIKDYRRWIAEWVNFDLDQHGHEPEDNDEEDEPEPSVSRKVGRNDPCPCGSGKKFKKCCLKK
jgi:preprotein translocase subunit SecA